jgi:cytochrome P450
MNQEYTIAVFRETLRLFPAEPRLAKLVCSDTTLVGKKTDENGEELSTFTVPIPNQSVVVLDIWAIHHNRSSTDLVGRHI